MSLSTMSVALEEGLLGDHSDDGVVEGNPRPNSLGLDRTFGAPDDASAAMAAAAIASVDGDLDGHYVPPSQSPRYVPPPPPPQGATYMSNRSTTSVRSYDTAWSEASDGGCDTPPATHMPRDFSPAYRLLEDAMPNQVARHQRKMRSRSAAPSFLSGASSLTGRRSRQFSGNDTEAEDEDEGRTATRRCTTSCSPPCSPRAQARKFGAVTGQTSGIDKCCFVASLAINVVLLVATTMCGILYLDLLHQASPVEPVPPPATVRMHGTLHACTKPSVRETMA